MSTLRRLLFFPLIPATVILCQSFARAQSQLPDAQSKAAGSISGRLTIGDKPAPGILVTASGVTAQKIAGQATSDNDGNYRIGGLAPGQLNIMPAAPVYVLPANSMYGHGKVVNLSPGESVDGIDFKLTRGGVITGRVTDAEGRPVIEQRVNLLQVDENGRPARVTYSRSVNYQMYLTDDRGVYRIYGLAAGRYKASVGNEPGTVSGLSSAGYYQKTYYPDVTDESRASIVDLNEGGEAKNIDISVGRRAATYTVSGRIVDADNGQPLPGIPFAFGVVGKDPNQTSYVAGYSSPGTPTNSQGEFRLEGVEPGHYAAFAGIDRFTFSSTPPNVYSDPVLFEVIDGDVTNLEIRAQRGLSLSGVVVPDGIVDEKVLARLANLRITANINQRSSSIRVMPEPRSCAVAGDGSFQIDGLRPGTAMLYLTGSSGLDARGFSISRIEREGVLQNRGIEIQPGQSVSGVRMYLAYGTGVVRGQVKVEGGTLPKRRVNFHCVDA